MCFDFNTVIPLQNSTVNLLIQATSLMLNIIFKQGYYNILPVFVIIGI